MFEWKIGNVFRTFTEVKGSYRKNLIFALCSPLNSCFIVHGFVRLFFTYFFSQLLFVPQLQQNVHNHSTSFVLQFSNLTHDTVLIFSDHPPNLKKNSPPLRVGFQTSRHCRHGSEDPPCWTNLYLPECLIKYIYVSISSSYIFESRYL